jgi:hypothetical protein
MSPKMRFATKPWGVSIKALNANHMSTMSTMSIRRAAAPRKNHRPSARGTPNYPVFSSPSSASSLQPYSPSLNPSHLPKELSLQ